LDITNFHFSCPQDAFAEFVAARLDRQVISYVNTTAAVKALTAVVVTSINARKIVESFPNTKPLSK
jgi:quinolinate synthase